MGRRSTAISLLSAEVQADLLERWRNHETLDSLLPRAQGLTRSTLHRFLLQGNLRLHPRYPLAQGSNWGQQIIEAITLALQANLELLQKRRLSPLELKAVTSNIETLERLNTRLTERGSGLPALSMQGLAQMKAALGLRDVEN